MYRDNYLPIYYSSGRVICQRAMTKGGDCARSRRPRGPPHPLPCLCRSLGPGFRPDIPQASRSRQILGSPESGPEVLGCSMAPVGAVPSVPAPPRQAAAELPFVSRPLETSAESWSRGASGTGCSRLHARARRRPRCGPACGLLAASPTRSPLFLLGPRPAQRLSSGSESLYHPLAQAPSAFVHPSLGFHPDWLLGSFF